MSRLNVEEAERLTKAQLVTRLLTTENDLETARRVATPSRVGEADALAGCVRALDEMLEGERRSRTNDYGIALSTSYGYSSSPQWNDDNPRPQGNVERVLRLLAAKYNVPLTEVRREPCQRPHVDSLNYDAVMQALITAGGAS